MAHANHPLQDKRDEVASTVSDGQYRYMPEDEKATHLIKKMAIWAYDQIINGNTSLGGSKGSVQPLLMEITGLSERTIFNALKAIPKSKSVTIAKSSRKPEFTEDDKVAVNDICNRLHQKGDHPKAKDLLRHFVQERRGIDYTITIKDFCRFLKSAGLCYGKTRFGLPMVVKTPRIQLWRIKYVRDYFAAVEAGRNVYFLDETFIHSADSDCGNSWRKPSDPASFNPKVATSRGVMFMVAGIGSKEGWVRDSSTNEHVLLFEPAADPSDDYHKNMNHQNFEKWMIKRVIPNLKRNSTIVMDNVGYHCRIPDRIPSKSATKSTMCDFIIKFSRVPPRRDQLMTNLKTALYEMCLGLNVSQTYALHEHLAPLGIDMLFLPPYHPVWNPIELQWARVKCQTKERNVDQTKEMCKKEFFKALDDCERHWPIQIGHCEKSYQEARELADEEVVGSAPSDTESDDE